MQESGRVEGVSLSGPNKGFVTPRYWEDSCPVCGQLAVSACRCTVSNRKCANGHEWFWSGGKQVLGSCSHGNVFGMEV